MTALAFVTAITLALSTQTMAHASPADDPGAVTKPVPPPGGGSAGAAVSLVFNDYVAGPMTLTALQQKAAADAQARQAADSASLQEANDELAAGLTAEDDTVDLGAGAIQPLTVASGHVLWGSNWIDPWHYKSQMMHNERLVDLNGDGIYTETDDVEVWFNETIIGGPSHRWTLTLHKRRHNGSMAYSSPAWIACAVNIKSNPDLYCPKWRDDGADANENIENFFNDEAISKDFGSTASGKKYPLLTLATHYADQATSAKGKFRGWDVCINSSTDHRLCTATGMGG